MFHYTHSYVTSTTSIVDPEIAGLIDIQEDNRNKMILRHFEYWAFPTNKILRVFLGKVVIKSDMSTKSSCNFLKINWI